MRTNDLFDLLVVGEAQVFEAISAQLRKLAGLVQFENTGQSSPRRWEHLRGERQEQCG